MVKTVVSAQRAFVSVTDIRARAYQLYLERGRVDGRHREDWLSAEHELQAAPAKRGVAVLAPAAAKP